MAHQGGGGGGGWGLCCVSNNAKKTYSSHVEILQSNSFWFLPEGKYELSC